MIKAICFDLDGVFFTSKGKNSFHNYFIGELGISKNVVDDFMYKSPEMAKLVRGQISPEDFWNRLREIMGIELSNNELSVRWIKDYEIDISVLEAVKNAKFKGFKTCVCTNNNSIRLSALIEKFKLKNIFDIIVSSHEIGYAKPDKQIFEALLSKLDVRGEELVYADDNEDRLEGAKELGINTFHFHDFQEYLNSLKKIGIDLEGINKFQR